MFQQKNKNTVVVKFKDGQIMVFGYDNSLKDFLTTIVSYTGDNRIESYTTSEDSSEDQVLAFLRNSTKYLVKYCPVDKNRGYKVMV